MFGRFKSALYNVVGNFDPTEGGSIGNIGTVSLASGVQNIPSVLRQNSHPGKEKTVKFPYTRPHFLQLNSEDEILVTADHALRPIVCPRDITRLPWNSGYAETVNAGKSKRNEDQAAVHVGLLTRSVNRSRKANSVAASLDKSVKDAKRAGDAQIVNGFVDKDDESARNASNSSIGTNSANGTTSSCGTNSTNSIAHPLAEEQNGHVAIEPPSKTPLNANDLLTRSNLITEKDEQEHIVSLPYYYFGVFDGHAGWGAAVSAANQLHHIIHEKLCDVIELIIPDREDKDVLCGPFWYMEKSVSAESAVVGALEQAFWAMDQQIAEDRQRHHLSGGCTACIALFILGKLFVSNAGDSRGIIGHNSIPVPMSFDFTPETETQRIRKLGARHPELLGGEFTHLEFLRRPLKSDLGKKAPFRDHYMRGWGLKTITEADLKYPLVCGEGKRSRVLATIGVTRGFGDHDLKAQFSSLPIKPFLSPEPEVRVFDLTKEDLTDKDVLILGTDGLWDIMLNERAVSVVCNSLEQFPPEDTHRYKYRYTSAAHDLVLWSRGRLKEHNWRTVEDKHSTIDDISVFVVPLKPYAIESEEWQAKLSCEVGVDISQGGVVTTKGGVAWMEGGAHSSKKGVVTTEEGGASMRENVASRGVRSGVATEELPSVPILMPSQQSLISATQSSTRTLSPHGDGSTLPTSHVQSQVLESSQHQSIVSSSHSSNPTSSNVITAISNTTLDSTCSSVEQPITTVDSITNSDSGGSGVTEQHTVCTNDKDSSQGCDT